jgi:uncharacterized protein YndB with AHSA1/START domain
MTEGEPLVLRMERVLPAPRENVYRALADPHELAKWWGPEGYMVRNIEFEPRVGGDYWIEMQPPDGDPFHLRGEFREVDPPSGLAFTFNWDPPDPDDRETVAELKLEDRGDQTKVSFTQGEFATEARRALHDGGWSDSFDKLERLLS